MTRYELLEKNGQVVIRYQEGDDEREITEHTISQRVSSEVLESEVDAEIELLRSLNDDPKHLSALGTNEMRKRIRSAIKSRKDFSAHTVDARARLQAAAEALDSPSSSLPPLSEEQWPLDWSALPFTQEPARGPFSP